MLHRLFTNATPAHAHCDLYCGVYDPAQAKIEALSCQKTIGKYHESDDEHFKTRCIIIKEERAQLAKEHLWVLWTDYFKPPHVEQFPDLHQVCWEAAKQCSAVKHTVDADAAQKLLDLIDRIEEMWKATGGAETTRIKRP